MIRKLHLCGIETIVQVRERRVVVVEQLRAAVLEAIAELWGAEGPSARLIVIRDYKPIRNHRIHRLTEQ